MSRHGDDARHWLTLGVDRIDRNGRLLAPLPNGKRGAAILCGPFLTEIYLCVTPVLVSDKEIEDGNDPAGQPPDVLGMGKRLATAAGDRATTVALPRYSVAFVRLHGVSATACV